MNVLLAVGFFFPGPEILTLDVDGDGGLAAGGGGGVQDPAGVGPTRVPVLWDHREHADRHLAFPVFHQGL